jgi:hypothetical protein
VHVIATNVSGGTLPADGRVEISFDRLLLPACITRQTFILQQSGGPAPLPPTVAYDPVARVVTITPESPLAQNQNYTLTIASPANAADPNGLRAIDGAELAPGSTATFGFMAGAPTGNPPPVTTYVDFCQKISGILSLNNCTGCHYAPPLDDGGLAAGRVAMTYAGLDLSSPVGVAMTALGRVAHGSNTGPLAGGGQQPGQLFAQDMPIIDPGPGPNGGGVEAGTPSTSGDPGHSWLMYKVLMAIPGTATGDAGVMNYTVTCSDAGDSCPQPLSDDERSRLAALVLGREMPYSNADTPSTGVPLDQLETLVQWIAGGAPLPASLNCPP